MSDFILNILCDVIHGVFIKHVYYTAGENCRLSAYSYTRLH